MVTVWISLKRSGLLTRFQCEQVGAHNIVSPILEKFRLDQFQCAVMYPETNMVASIEKKEKCCCACIRVPIPESQRAEVHAYTPGGGSHPLVPPGTKCDQKVKQKKQAIGMGAGGVACLNRRLGRYDE